MGDLHTDFGHFILFTPYCIVSDGNGTNGPTDMRNEVFVYRERMFRLTTGDGTRPNVMIDYRRKRAQQLLRCPTVA